MTLPKGSFQTLGLSWSSSWVQRRSRCAWSSLPGVLEPRWRAEADKNHLPRGKEGTKADIKIHKGNVSPKFDKSRVFPLWLRLFQCVRFAPSNVCHNEQTVTLFCTKSKSVHFVFWYSCWLVDVTWTCLTEVLVCLSSHILHWCTYGIEHSFNLICAIFSASKLTELYPKWGGELGGQPPRRFRLSLRPLHHGRALVQHHPLAWRPRKRPGNDTISKCQWADPIDQMNR